LDEQRVIAQQAPNLNAKIQELVSNILAS
jgi:glutamate decarboxylase